MVRPKDLLRVSTSSAGALASLISLVLLPVGELSSIQQAILVFGIIFLLGTLYREYRNLPVQLNSEEKIKDYMYNLIDNGGNVAICSRRLSWADGSDELEELLYNKADENDLHICMPYKTDFAEELEERGADIIE